MAVTTREAGPDDAAAVATLLGLPEAATDRLLRARTVRLAVRDDEPVGCLAYDVHGGAVQVTRLGGDPTVLEALLAAPLRLARVEGLPVEVLVPAAEAAVVDTVTDAGFEAAGSGPVFQGAPTTRYRREPPG